MRFCISLICHFVTFAVLLAAPCLAEQDKSAAYTLPDNPALAWDELEKLRPSLLPPRNWRTQSPSEVQIAEFQKQVRAAALGVSAKTREFILRFPKDENLGEARNYLIYSLAHAVAAGDSGAEMQIADFVAEVLTDHSIPEDSRAGVLLSAGNVPFMKKVGMSWFTEGNKGKLRAEAETAAIDAMRTALKQFPTISFIHTMMVAYAERAEGNRRTELATEILNAPGAPAGAKSLAKHILKGTKPFELGKPVDFRFTALDGRKVDLSALAGKVVLIEFWSTTCPPCVAEMPTIKAAFQKFHGRGFEIIGISLDDKESAVRKFVTERELLWPQHFDGRGWENEFAVRYGVFSIPTMWLIDKHGNLRETQARGSLEESVIGLLNEPSPSAQ